MRKRPMIQPAQANERVIKETYAVRSSDLQGFIFNIERFSTTDGPGIRTIVFFKGCNMSCPWCHNPEGISSEAELEFNKMRCIRCGRCLQVCPTGAQQTDASGAHRIDRSLCIRCMACAKECPSGALNVIGKHMAVEDCFQEIAEDVPFYNRSGGGVTLSGGEVLLQADFAAALLKRCRAAGIHTAIESNLSLPYRKLETLLPFLDLVMADIKHLDETAHASATSLPNRATLVALNRLAQHGMPLIVRTPVVPGFNDSPETIGRIAAFASGLASLEYFELLSYSPLGCEKAERLGRIQRRYETPPGDRMNALAETAARYLKDVRLNGRRWTNDQGESS